MQSLRLLSGVACVLLCAVAVSGQFAGNGTVPYSIFHTAQNTLYQTRGYPSCAWNVHAIANHGSANNVYQFGGQSSPYAGGSSFSCCQGFIGTMDYSSSISLAYPYATTFTPTFNFSFSGISGGYTGFNPIARVAGGAAVLMNGNVVLMGGKTAPNWAYGNDVIYSNNFGQNWFLSTGTASWVARSDMSVAVAPLTNTMVLIGGEYTSSNNPPYLNDVWLSTDGIGAVWTQQTPNAPFYVFQDGPMTFMWDGQAAGGSQANPTLVLYNPDDNNVYSSTNLGSNWNFLVSMTSQGANPQQTGKMVCDIENYLYLAGGAEVNGQTYYSQNKGLTWTLMNQATFYPGLRISDPITVNSFTYGCLALNYVADSGAPLGYRKQLIEYGGFLSYSQNINSYYGCVSASELQAATSVTADLIFPGETVTSFGQFNGTGLGNFVTNSTLIFHDAANQLTYRAYSDFAYDVHAAITRTSSFRMWQLGGFTASWGYIPTIDYTSTGTWNSFTTFTPTYNMGSSGYAAPSGKVAAGVGLLANGNLVIFGGKDSNATYSSWTNDVYYSTNNGQSFTLVTFTAQWSVRSDMSVAVMPGTNTIVMGGGAYPPNGWNLQDWWYSSDGQAAVWNQGATTTPFGIFQDAALVAMYDNKAISSQYTNQYSTLFVNPGQIAASNADGIWMSTNAAQSWTFVLTAPWTQRIRGNFVSDMENYLYMIGGQPSLAGDCWVSTTYGTSWSLLRQTTTSTIWPNTFSLQQAQQNAMAIRYAANPNSPGGYHKTLILWGGPADPGLSLTSIQVSQRPAPSCVRTIPANVVYAEVMFPSEIGNPAFTDTLATAPNTAAPIIAFNNPTALLTYRTYSACAADVHAPMNGNTPNSYALGGWDANGNALTTLDRIAGNNINGYTYIVPSYGAGTTLASGRVAAAVAAVTVNGNLLYGGGKVGIASSYGNDVWYSTNQGVTFNVSILAAPWAPRSDAASTAIPGTNCVIMIGGEGVYVNPGDFNSGEVFFNDVWTSCDGIGASWTQQNGGAPFATGQQASLVALYDNGGSTTNPTSTIVYYSFADGYVRSTNNMGATWASLGEVPWSARQGKFVADTSNNIYAPGGMNPNNNGGDSGNYDNGIGDVWYSSNKGQGWTRITQSTTVGYVSPVTLSNAAYSCATLVPGVSPHRQVIVYSNWVEVYSATASFVTANSWWGAAGIQCICDSLNGIRGVIGDLVFPGETPNNLPGGGSSTSSTGASSVTVSSSTGSSNSNTGGTGGSNNAASSTTYSPGQVAGIAIGVGIGCMLLVCLLGLLLFSCGALSGRAGGKSAAPGPRHTKMENEPSQSAQTAGSVEMGSTS